MLDYGFFFGKSSVPGKPVRLVINGQNKDLHASETIAQMLKELDITGPHIAVALNFQVVPRSTYDQTPLNEGDKVEIVHAVGGG